jgi:protein-tyrosine phosphatase
MMQPIQRPPSVEIAARLSNYQERISNEQPKLSLNINAEKILATTAISQSLKAMPDLLTTHSQPTPKKPDMELGIPSYASPQMTRINTKRSELRLTLPAGNSKSPLQRSASSPTVLKGTSELPSTPVVAKGDNADLLWSSERANFAISAVDFVQWLQQLYFPENALTSLPLHSRYNLRKDLAVGAFPIILDLRPVEDYEHSSLLNSVNLNIPAIWFRRMQKGNTSQFVIENFVANGASGEEALLKGERKDVILLDERMEIQDVGADCWTVFDALRCHRGFFPSSTRFWWVEGGYEAVQEVLKTSVSEQVRLKMIKEKEGHLPSASVTQELAPLRSEVSAAAPSRETRRTLSQRRTSNLRLTPIANSSSYSTLLENQGTFFASSPDENRPEFKIDYTEVLPNLYLGNDPCNIQHPIDFFRTIKVQNILNTAKECEDQWGRPDDIRYKKCNLQDHTEENIEQVLHEAIQFIGKHFYFMYHCISGCSSLLWSDDCLKRNECIYVHCRAGQSRSVTVVLAYLVDKKNMKVSQAYEFVKQKRPNISPNIGFMTVLQQFESSLTSVL